MATKKIVGNMTEADLKGKKVFLHADLNVPLDDDHKNITDDTSIRASVPTIKFLTEKGAKVILASHPGRPKGVTPKYSLKHLVPLLSELLAVDVVMARITEDDIEQLASTLPDGGVLLLDTPSFYEEEEKNDPEFAKKLASVADIYVNDAFAHGALREGKILPGVFAFDINDGITSVMATKHGLPDKTSHHIAIDDWELPVGKSHRTLPDDTGVFGENGPEGKVIHHHVSDDAGRGRGRASMKAHEGKGLPGVFNWSGDNGSMVPGKSGLEDKKVSNHI